MMNKRSAPAPLAHWPASEELRSHHSRGDLVEAVFRNRKREMHWAAAPVTSRVPLDLQYDMALFALQVSALIVPLRHGDPQQVVIEVDRLGQILHVEENLFYADNAHAMFRSLLNDQSSQHRNAIRNVRVCQEV